jgi:hypothetical protein
MTASPIPFLTTKSEAVIDWLDMELVTFGRYNGGKLKAHQRPGQSLEGCLSLRPQSSTATTASRPVDTGSVHELK